MPCLKCGARQDDPVAGPSPWKRGVQAGVQVLICPECQRAAGWQAELDRCPVCDGIRLSKTLGVLRCSGCGWSGVVSATGPAAATADERLRDDVSAALHRMLGGGDETPDCAPGT